MGIRGASLAPLGGRGKEAGREQARANARGRGAWAKLRAAEEIEQLAERCERVAQQTAQRLRGEKIAGRIVSHADPDARPIGKGKAGKPNEFGYVAQICELTQNAKPGARGFVLPPASGAGNLSENTPAARHCRRADRPRLASREVALDAASAAAAPRISWPRPSPDRVFVSGRRAS